MVSTFSFLRCALPHRSLVKASTFDDLVAQLDEIKTITVAGGLDGASIDVRERCPV
jgi:hypothetical protein